jgi:probable F420-dependent oxidoreductase
MSMDFGVHLPHIGRQASGDALRRFATAIDQLGVHSGWSSDHVAWPREVTSQYPYTEDGSFPGGFDMPWLDPIGTLFFVAACTERLQLGNTVLILGYRPPLLTAKAFASLDVMSGGRALLGVGVGWMKEEFDVLQMPWDHRGARADEQIALFQKVWSEPEPSFEGKYYSFPSVGFSPRPERKIPIWVGGDTEPAFRRTLRCGDAFHAAFQTIDEVDAAWKRMAELAPEYNRSIDEITLSIRLYLDPDGSMEAKKAVAGSVDQMVDTVGKWKGIGVSHILLDPVARGGVDGRLAAVEKFMTEVAPQV